MITPQNFRDFVIQLSGLQKDIAFLINLNKNILQQINAHEKLMKPQLESVSKITNKVIQDFGIINSSVKKLAVKSVETET